MKNKLFTLLIIMSVLTACSSKQPAKRDNQVKISSELASLIDNSFKKSKFLNTRPSILLMHVLYDSLGRTKVIITPTSSARVVKMHSPDFISKIGPRVVFVYNSNGNILYKGADYLARTKFITDSILATDDIKGRIYIDDIKRISFKNEHPYLDYSSKLMSPLFDVAPLPYPPIPILNQ